ncbi:glycosyl hydrolase [Cellvibrio mixtus]|uniref:glycosyl hydrolase n=1 Tax=Cellvibrio mixtus TaxID=39650 RepID=UPI0005866085|nr:glycosyl hydrolase [Cellvibrio mixtus]
MKTPLRLLTPGILALSVGLAAANSYAQSPIWADEFNGTRIDNSTWSYKVGGDGNGNGELQYYTARSENAYIEDGKLVIEAKREAYEGKQFTSARLHTNGRVAFKYGTLEARIKIPRLDNGLWPAFWMLGTNFGLDGWPKSGEWDILEAGYKSAQTNGTVNKSVSAALHWWHESGTWSDWLQADSAASTTLPVNLYEDYHTYKLDWTPSKVTISVDGNPYFTMDITDPNMAEFRDNPASIILNLAVGGFNFVEITDPAQITAPFPAKMYIDYVRLYANANTELTVASDDLPSGNFGVSTETTPVLNELNWGDRTSLYVWNNMTNIAITPSEGSGALAYSIAPGNWWGMGLVHKDYNMRNYKHGYLHLDIKTSSTSSFSIGMASTSGGDGKVDFNEGGDQYGLVRDGNWHHVAIPLSKFCNLDFETIKTFFSVFGPAPAAAMEIAFDNIYLTESIALQAPEFGNFGIYTETPDHKNAGEFAFGVSGDLFLWDNTLTLETGANKEGNSALHLKSTGKGWYGMGLTARDGFNLTAFDNPNAKLHFSLKTTHTGDFQIGFKSGPLNGIGQKWINFKAGNDPYGFARDGQWHEIQIPVSELAKDLDLFDVRQLLQVLGGGETAGISIDDVYLSGGQAAKDPGTNGTVVNRAPSAAVKTSIMGGIAPAIVTFDGTKSVDVNGDALTYSWDFGDGSTGTGATTNHTYTSEGSYHVMLTVSDGELNSTAKTVIFVDKDFGKTGKSKKRGLGYGTHSVEDLAVISKGISWWYNWSHSPDLAVKDVYQQYGVEFVPMAWNGNFNDQAMRAYIAAHPDVKYILAFNEPNFIDQANMTPSQAVAQWPRLEAIANEFGLKIVSVAMNYCGNCVTENGTTYYSPFDYFDDFFRLCPTCKVDAISIHAYMPDVNGVEWYVNEFKKYGKPIWMTEFSAWETVKTLDDQKRMLIQVVDSFENNADMQRYAWFTGRRNGHPFNGLFDYRQSGVLAELGNIYVNMPVHGDTSVHTLPKLVQAENYATRNGIRVEETKDVSGFLNLSDVAAGEWVEYNVTGSAANYDVNLRVASEASGTINVLVDGVQKAVINVASTGGLQTWATVNSQLALTAGAHKLRLVFNQAINVNWVKFTVASASSSSVATSSSRSASSVSLSSSSKSLSSSSVKSSSSSVVSSSKSSSPVASSSSSVTVTPFGNLALNRPTVASTTEGETWAAGNATDASTTTRWASISADPQWIMVDLGASHSFNQIVLQWESAYGKSYSIQTSTNGASWTTIYQTTTGVGGREVLNVSGTGRYVRVYGTERGTGYGYSLYDFQVNNIAVASSSSKSSISVASSSVVSSSVVSSSVVSSAAGTVNLALNRPAVASSDEWGGNSAPQAVDGNTGTRWASQFIDNQWIYVDLGSSKTISRVFLKWEGAYAKAYNIQVSNDATNWTTIKSEANSDGGVDDHAVSGTGRYVRILGITRANGYGISLWDFEVY